MNRDCKKGAIGQATIADLGLSTYQGVYSGGLYGNGLNIRTQIHNAIALAAAESVEPLDAAGSPSSTGKIGLVGFGFSDAKLTWDAMSGALYRDPASAPRPEIVSVNCAKDGQDAVDWSVLTNSCWTVHTAAQLVAAGITAAQVQVAWMMTGVRGSGVPFPQHVADLQALLAEIARNAKAFYPNLKLLYLDSVPGQHYLGSGMTAYEPFYFEQGLAVQGVIRQQVSTQDPYLSPTPQWGPVVAPVLDWGGALWCDGPSADSRGHIWKCPDDVMNDGHHPSIEHGAPKLAGWIVDRWLSDGVARRWLIGAPPGGTVGGGGGVSGSP